MKQRRADFAKITAADFIVRSAYQMGKTPLLPILAAALGATDAFLGFIVAVSTLTGMLTKPLIGILSDRWGRRWWLILGTLFFAGVPFFYRFIETPQQLFAIRILHGTATAIYGPVTLAYVAEQDAEHRAEKLGWFGMARSGGYIVGPAVAGWLLLTLAPATVFTLIGLLSLVAFVPILLLSEPAPDDALPRPALRRQIQEALKSGSHTPAVWLSGGLEATVYVATYAMKAFLPIYALSAGYNTAQVGLFFSVQEGVHLVLKPAGGRLGDRFGYLSAISLGMLVIGVSLPLLAYAGSAWALLALAVVIGMAQALIFPATVALVSAQIAPQHLGAGMGLIGTLKNAGKVAGPILGGLLIAWLDFTPMFWTMGILLLGGSLVVGIQAQRLRRHPLSPQQERVHHMPGN